MVRQYPRVIVTGSLASGRQGPEGPPGPAGPVTWRSGSGAPAGSLGAVTDWYLDQDTGDTYEKTGESAWTLRANIKGADGAPGPDPAIELANPLSAASQAIQTRFAPMGRYLIADISHSIGAAGVISYGSGPSVLSGWVVGGSISYMAKAIPQTLGRFTWLGTAATAGATLQQIINLHLADVLASNAHYVHVNALTNSVGQVEAGTLTLAQLKTQYADGMIAPILAAGKIPIVAGLTPIAGTGNTAPSTASRLLQRKINAWLKTFAEARGLPFVDYAQVTTDSTNGAWRAGHSSDHVHPNDVGAQAMAVELARVLNQLPGMRRPNLAGSYDTSLAAPDACVTSAGADKAFGTGNTTSNFGFATASDAQGLWRGNKAIVRRGGAGNYTFYWPTTGFTWVPGNRVRVSMGIDVPLVGGGNWSAGLFNVTELTPVCGISGETRPLTRSSVALAGTAGVTSGSPTITAPAGTFRPEHVGRVVTAFAGVAGYFPAGTVIRGVSADGTTATASANATATQAASNLFVHGPSVILTHEFTVQASQVGDDIRGYLQVAGADGVIGAAHQMTIEDLTALEVA